MGHLGGRAGGHLKTKANMCENAFHISSNGLSGAPKKKDGTGSKNKRGCCLRYGFSFAEAPLPPPQDRIPVQVEHLQLATFHQSGVHINIASRRHAMPDSKSFFPKTECGSSSQIYRKNKKRSSADPYCDPNPPKPILELGLWDNPDGEVRAYTACTRPQATPFENVEIFGASR